MRLSPNRPQMPDPVPALLSVKRVRAYTSYGDPTFTVDTGRDLEWPQLKAPARAIYLRHPEVVDLIVEGIACNANIGVFETFAYLGQPTVLDPEEASPAQVAHVARHQDHYYEYSDDPGVWQKGRTLKVWLSRARALRAAVALTTT